MRVYLSFFLFLFFFFAGCLCNPQFAFGGGCNPRTGQCECLRGVVGQNCDRCPHRWVLIKNVGCEPCDTCIDGLLDDTDLLTEMIEPLMADFNVIMTA